MFRAPVVLRAFFSGARLGNVLRSRRLVQVACSFLRGTGGTITGVISQTHQAKAAYRLFDRPEVTHREVTAPYLQATLDAMSQPGRYLLLEDTSTLAFHSRSQASDLGPIGEGYTQGLLFHTTLVVKANTGIPGYHPLGIAGQECWVRPQEPDKTQKRRREAPAGRALESDRWGRSLRGHNPPSGVEWISVADREADIFEYFLDNKAHGRKMVVRAAQPRALGGSDAGMDLFEAAKQAPVLGRQDLFIPREDRTAKLTIRARQLDVRGPQRPGGRLEDQTLNVVQAWEENPPAGSKAVGWVLLTDMPVETLEQCLEVIEIYRHRWLIEEFHKCLKTGFEIESSQLSDLRRLLALLGLLSVLSVYLLQMKTAARNDPDALVAKDDADEAWVKVVEKLNPPRDGRKTRRWFWRAVAMMGGFMGRKGDGDPGWLTLWRGWRTLQMYARGYELFSSAKLGE